jgi:hypothetical protein
MRTCIEEVAFDDVLQYFSSNPNCTPAERWVAFYVANTLHERYGNYAILMRDPPSLGGVVDLALPAYDEEDVTSRLAAGYIMSLALCSAEQLERLLNVLAPGTGNVVDLDSAFGDNATRLATVAPNFVSILTEYGAEVTYGGLPYHASAPRARAHVPVPKADAKYEDALKLAAFIIHNRLAPYLASAPDFGTAEEAERRLLSAFNEGGNMLGWESRYAIGMLAYELDDARLDDQRDGWRLKGSTTHPYSIGWRLNSDQEHLVTLDPAYVALYTKVYADVPSLTFSALNFRSSCFRTTAADYQTKCAFVRDNEYLSDFGVLASLQELIGRLETNYLAYVNLGPARVPDNAEDSPDGEDLDAKINVDAIRPKEVPWPWIILGASVIVAFIVILSKQTTTTDESPRDAAG